MFRKALALGRIPSERVEVFPNCQRIGLGNFFDLEPSKEYCLDFGYFIASNKTNYEVTAKYISKENSEISEPVIVKNPFVVSYDSSNYDIQSKVKCLETSGGCKIQIFKVHPSINSSESWEEDGIIKNINQIVYSYFSTKSSDSLSFEVKQIYGSSEVNNKKELICFIQTVIYQNADNSIKEITRASTNENIKAIISEDDLSNVKTFTVSVEFPDIDFEKSAKDEGTITLNLNKKTDPPEEEEMLFEKDKQYIVYGENKIKSRSEIEVETNTTSKEISDPNNPNGSRNNNPTITQKPSKLTGWQIGLIIVGVIAVIAIIIVVAVIFIKKGKNGSKSGSGSGENV